jgi:hypothetical protein
MSLKYYDPQPVEFDLPTGKFDFLLSSGDIKKRGDPKFKFDAAVLNLIKFDGSPNCLLTFRKFDDYGEEQEISQYGGLYTKKHYADQSPKDRSHAGVLGRLFTGLRAKLIEVNTIINS